MALVAILLCVNFTSCEKEPILTLSLSVQQITAPSSGNSTSVIVNANTPWYVSGNYWCTVSPSSGEGGEVPVTVTVKENTTYDARNCTLTFTSAGLTQSISVNQESNNGIVLPKNTYDVSSDVQQISVEVKANVEYDISIDVDWIKQSGTKALTSNKILFNISANDTYDNRIGKITIKQTDGSLSETIVVNQCQKDGLFASPSEFFLSKYNHNIEVAVEANVDYVVSCEEEWIHIISTKALSSNTISLSIDPNYTFEQRIGVVHVKDNKGLLERCITISQEPDEIIVFEDNRTKQICVSNWDANKDGELSQLEASKVQSIGQVFKGSSIRSFNEFRFFVSVSEVGYLSFSASSIKEIVFPDNITTVGQEAFTYCRSLKSLVFNEKLVGIGSWAFSDCSSLSVINLPLSLQSLGDYVFRNTPIRKVIIPDNVVNLGINPFTGCTMLEEIESKYSTLDKRCLIKDGKLLSFASKGVYKYSFSSEVKEVGDDVFSDLSEIEELSFLIDTHTFGDHAFIRCSSLKTVTLENQGAGVTQLGTMLFQECTSLDSFDISKANKLFELPQRLFYGCNSLIEFTIPESVEAIKPQAFIFCRNLTSINCLPIEPPVLHSISSNQPDVFEGTPNKMKVYVLNGSVENYKNAYTWLKYANRIEPLF